VDDSSRTEICTYHPGLPIFHETLKKWSCCGGKAMEFEKFMEIEGCKKGLHKFVEKINTDEQVHCRHDWYQLPASVIMSIYAKKINQKESKIDLEPQKVNVALKFDDGKTYSKVFNLVEPIDPSKSKFEYLSTKIEFKLHKANGKQWSDLEKK